MDVDATALVELRAGLKKDGAHAPGLLAFIARFVTAGLKYPELNTRIETAPDGSQEIVAFEGINLGFAAQTDRGLVVPSIRSAEKLSARELDAEIRRLTAVARGGKASPAELGSGTFTLNNYGVFGVDICSDHQSSGSGDPWRWQDHRQAVGGGQFLGRPQSQ